MKKIVTRLTVAGLLAFTGNSFATTANGDLGATSTGTVDVEVSISDLVRISGLVAMTGNTYTPGSAVTDSTPVCIYRNGAPNYEITVSSANGAGTDFFLDSGTDEVVYVVTFNDGVGGATDLNNATLESSFQAANQTSIDCLTGAGGNATLAISVPETDATFNGLAEVPAATYTDELTILVAPR
jgi:hypothetical protein